MDTKSILALDLFCNNCGYIYPELQGKTFFFPYKGIETRCDFPGYQVVFDDNHVLVETDYKRIKKCRLKRVNIKNLDNLYISPYFYPRFTLLISYPPLSISNRFYYVFTLLKRQRHSFWNSLHYDEGNARKSWFFVIEYDENTAKRIYGKVFYDDGEVTAEDVRVLELN